MTGRRPALERGEEGLTLIELLATLAIMGIAFVVIIGGMFASVLGSDVHRKQANADAILRSFAEAVKVAPYDADCAATYDPGAVNFSSPSPDYVPAVVRVEYLNPAWTSSSPPGVPPFLSACSPESVDPGIQRVALKVASARGDETVEIVKRNP